MFVTLFLNLAMPYTYTIVNIYRVYIYKWTIVKHCKFKVYMHSAYLYKFESICHLYALLFLLILATRFALLSIHCIESLTWIHCKEICF